MTAIDTSDATLMRTFDLRDGGVVELYVWPPVSEDDGRNYACPYLITGLWPDKLHWGHGVDGLQALNLAMFAVGAQLYNSEAYKVGGLTYLGTRDLDLPTAGYQPKTNDYEKADLLNEVGSSTIVRLPGDAFASLTISGGHMNGLIERLQALSKVIGIDGDKAREDLTHLVSALEEQQHYYEAICRQAGVPIPYMKPAS